MYHETTFEHCGHFIAVRFAGSIIARCPASLTDIRMDESLDDFVARKGGHHSVAVYLAACLRAEN